jgi:uncharacterized protein (TIGR02246 family)
MMRSLVVAAFMTMQLASSHAQDLSRKTAPAIEQVLKAFETAFNTKDAAKLASFYAEDAVWLPPGYPVVVGRTDIQAAFNAMVAAGGTLKFSSIASETSGDQAFAAGTYSVTVSSGASLTSTGVGGSGQKVMMAKYLTVFRRIRGDWKITYDMQNATTS